MTVKKPYNILLVEDNPGDIFLLKEAFNFENVNVDLKIIKDGAAALDYLFNSVATKAEIEPELVILDLNLPKVNGIEILQQIKSDENLKKMRTIVLSSSRYEEDVTTCINLGAANYYVKPLDFDEYGDLVKSIEQEISR